MFSTARRDQIKGTGLGPLTALLLLVVILGALNPKTPKAVEAIAAG